jgi:hypothetical protein
VRHDDEVFYLEAALRPGDREDSGTSVRVITSEELAGIEPRARGTAAAIDLDEFDVVVLANVAALPAARVNVLADWMRAGGGILVSPGDHVDPAAYDRTMLPVMPQSLRDPIDTTWGAPPDERDSRALHLVKWEADHPIFTPFSKAAPELAEAKFFEISLLGPTTSADRKVLARFTTAPRPWSRRRSGPAARCCSRPPSIATGTICRSIPGSCRSCSRPCATSPASTPRSATPITRSVARWCCRPGISRSSRSARPTASAPCSRAIAWSVARAFASAGPIGPVCTA